MAPKNLRVLSSECFFSPRYLVKGMLEIFIGISLRFLAPDGGFFSFHDTCFHPQIRGMGEIGSFLSAKRQLCECMCCYMGCMPSLIRLSICYIDLGLQLIDYIGRNPLFKYDLALL